MSMEAANKFYAVQRGHNRGIYSTWQECQVQINGFRYPKFRKFNDYNEALRFAFPERFPLNSIETEESIKQDWVKTDKQKALELELNYLKTKDYLEKKEEELVLPKGKEMVKPVEVWISGFRGNHGVIGVFFGDNDKRNFVGIHTWKGALTIARLRLAACIKTIEILSKESACPCTVIIHTENYYLAKTLIHWTKEWFSRGKDIAWAKSESNHDMLETLCVLCREHSVKILPVCSKTLDENMIKISAMVSEYTPFY